MVLVSRGFSVYGTVKDTLGYKRTLKDTFRQACMTFATTVHLGTQKDTLREVDKALMSRVHLRTLKDT